MNVKRLRRAERLQRARLDRDPSSVRVRLRLASYLFCLALADQPPDTVEDDAAPPLDECVDQIFTGLSLSRTTKDREYLTMLLELVRMAGGRALVNRAEDRSTRHIIHIARDVALMSAAAACRPDHRLA